MKATDVYRLEALLELAGCYPNVLTASEIAARRRMPQKFLARLLAQLGRDGLVTSQRGAGGGVRLAQAPVNVPMSLVFGLGSFVAANTPAVRHLQEKLENAREAVLAGVSLAQLRDIELASRDNPDFEI